MCVCATTICKALLDMYVENLPYTCIYKVLSSKLEDQQFNNLFQSATLTDRARLLSISSPHESFVFYPQIACKFIKYVSHRLLFSEDLKDKMPDVDLTSRHNIIKFLKYTVLRSVHTKHAEVSNSFF